MVTSRGTGRKDYSKNTELSVMKIVRSHQVRFIGRLTTTVPALSSVGFYQAGKVTPHLVYDLSVVPDADSIHLFQVQKYDSNLNYVSTLSGKWGYTKTEMEYLHGIESLGTDGDEVLVFGIFNYDTVDHDYTLRVSGLIESKTGYVIS